MENNENKTEPQFQEVIDSQNDPKNIKVADERLKSFISRIQNLEEEKKELSADIREVYAEAKGAGYDAKAIRLVLKLMSIDPMERDEQDFLVAEYRKIVGV